jgi:hypothetical protein
MSLTTGTVLVGGTTSTTGGTSTGFLTKGDTLGQKNLILDDGSEYASQTQANFTIKDPVTKASAPNGFSQQRSKIQFLVPLSLDNGNRTFNTLTIELAYDVETTSSEKDALIALGVQTLNGSDFSDFWKQQVLS